MKPDLKCPLAAVFAGAMLTWPLQGQVVGVSNLSESVFGYVYDVYSGQFVAMNFTTGPGAGWPLASLDLRLDSYGVNPGELTVSLNADSSGLPGALIDTLSTPVPPVLLGDYNFVPGYSVWLAPETTYWVLASGTGTLSEEYGWEWASGSTPTGETGLPGWTILDGVAGSSDGGLNWSVYPYQIIDFGNGIQLAVNQPAIFGVNLVPEPHEYALLAGLGLIVFAARRRRRA